MFGDILNRSMDAFRFPIHKICDKVLNGQGKIRGWSNQIANKLRRTLVLNKLN